MLERGWVEWVGERVTVCVPRSGFHFLSKLTVGCLYAVFLPPCRGENIYQVDGVDGAVPRVVGSSF